MAERWVIHHGDVLDRLPDLEAESFDAVLCDPPYGLSFMGRAWDHGVPGAEVWGHVLAALKPGAHCLAFGGTRTWHRLCCGIEDAGFEIRDCAMWLYGSGFPKSLAIDKSIDKCNGEGNRLHKFTAWMRTTGVTAKQINGATDTFMGSHYLTAGSQPAIPTAELWRVIRPLCGEVPAWVDELVERIEAEREVVGRSSHRSGIANGVGSHHTVGGTIAQHVDITTPATTLAKRFHGYGTALKPAWEPCIVAMKPCAGTFAANAAEHGVAGLWIDGGRVDGGRWPANLVFDSESVNQLGAPSRYFYTAKASTRERNAGLKDGVNRHPTLKPIDLCRYLATLILPPKRDTPRRLLVPFSGSGSEMIGALLAGWDEVVGIEREQEYIDIAERRLAHWCASLEEDATTLFAESA